MPATQSSTLVIFHAKCKISILIHGARSLRPRAMCRALASALSSLMSEETDLLALLNEGQGMWEKAPYCGQGLALGQPSSFSR